MGKEGNDEKELSYMEKRRQWSQIGKPKKEKKVYRIPQKSAKKIAEEKAEKELGSELTLDMWFEKGMKENQPVCAECGMRADWLLEPQTDPKKAEAYKLMWRASQAHILPKKKRYGFPSLATDPNNRIILFPSWGGHLCGCHGFYDSGWFNATTMKIWPLVVETFKTKLYPLIAESEKKNIPNQLLEALDNT